MAASSSYSEKQCDEGKVKQQVVLVNKYRGMFDYSLSTPRHPMPTEWSAKRNNPNQRKLIKYPFPIEWNCTKNEIEGINNDHRIEPYSSTTMPSSNQRSASSSISRSSRRNQTHRQIQTSRSSSVPPSRQFLIILTNNSEMLRQTSTFRLRIAPLIQTATVRIPNNSNHIEITNHNTTTITANNNNNNNHTHDNHHHQNHNNDREHILTNLLRVELSQATRDYLSRTRRSFPVHYIFDMSDIESQQHEQQQP